MEIFTALNKNFAQYFDLAITNLTLNSYKLPITPAPHTAPIIEYNMQEMKVELQPLPSKNKTIQLILSLTEDMLSQKKLAFDKTVANIPNELEGDERLVARLGYMIYQAYKATQNRSPDMQPPEYLKSWNVSSQYYY